MGVLEPDPETIEAIARWLEASARHAKPWEQRRLAEQLRTGEWRDMPQVRSDQAIILARADDAIARGRPLTHVERYVVDQRDARRLKAHLAEERRNQKIIDQIEAYANGHTP